MTLPLRTALLGLAGTLIASATAAAQCDALYFDGVDDFATILDTNNDFDLGARMTFEAWVNVEVPQSGGGIIGGTTSSGGAAYNFCEGLGTPTDFLLTVSTPFSDAVIAPGAAAPGTWRHIAATFDGTNFDFYVNGLPVASSVHYAPGTSSLVTQLILGRFATSGSTGFFQGYMDEVRIWGMNLSAAQILSNYNTELTGSEQFLLGYYKFDEGSGDVILDSSTKGNHGFLGASAAAGTDSPTRVPTGITFGSCASNATAYCFGDGSGTACPCGNNGGANEGCANSTGAGATLSALGSSSVAANDLALSSTHLLANQPALLFAGNNAVNGGLGSVFGDGLRCAGQGVVRLGVAIPDAGGNASWGPGLNAAGGWTSGDTRYFQTWYRNPVSSPCGSSFNLSHGLQVDFVQ
jgi:hypothetical protein